MRRFILGGPPPGSSAARACASMLKMNVDYATQPHAPRPLPLIHAPVTLVDTPDAVEWRVLLPNGIQFTFGNLVGPSRVFNKYEVQATIDDGSHPIVTYVYNVGPGLESEILAGLEDLCASYQRGMNTLATIQSRKP
jgi:hypothetical protein